MGNNGVGKTSIARSLQKRLSQDGWGEVIYHPGCQYLILDKIMNLFFLKKREQKRNEFCQGKKRFLFLLWPFLVYIDSLISYFLFRILSRKKIFIFDRYFYDWIVTFEYLGYSTKLLRWLFCSLPIPDVVFLIDVSAKVACERKENNFRNLEYYQKRRRIYLEIAERLKIPVINNQDSLLHTVETIYTKIREQTNETG